MSTSSPSWTKNEVRWVTAIALALAVLTAGLVVVRSNVYGLAGSLCAIAVAMRLTLLVDARNAPVGRERRSSARIVDIRPRSGESWWDAFVRTHGDRPGCRCCAEMLEPVDPAYEPFDSIRRLPPSSRPTSRV